MSLVVETGAGLANAESYCSVAQADAYFAARGITTWDIMTTTEKEQSLRRGTDYLGEVYGQRWRGVRVSTVQALDWPRYDVASNGYPVPSDSVPAGLVNACAAMAYRAAQGELAPDVGRLKKRVKVGPIETEYVDGGSGLTRYTAIDNMLAGLLGSSGSMMRVVRA